MRDVLTTLARRFPQAVVLIYPSDVQGKSAAPQLIVAIQRANIEKRCDVLILARSGGSIEDLWAFNDESLAYTIAGSLIPIVSGVGHETDFTIADFVADFRAVTPTAAAEAVTPDQVELMAYFQLSCDRLLAVIQRFVQYRALLLRHEIQKIASPGQLIASYWQTLDYLERHLFQAAQYSLTQKQHQLHLLIARLQAQNPRLLFLQATTQVGRLESQLFQVMRNYLLIIKQRFHSQLVTLHAVSPLATLDRGYALVTHDHRLLFDSKDADIGDLVTIRLAKGHLICEVLEHVEPSRFGRHSCNRE